MNKWEVNNGSVVLVTANGIILPSAEDLYSQKDSDIFKYKNDIYEPISNLKLRFSSLIAHPKVILDIVEEHIQINLKVEIKNQILLIQSNNNIFNNYILFDNQFRSADNTVNTLNKIISSLGLTITKLTFKEYIHLIRCLKLDNISYIDNVFDHINNKCQQVDDVPTKLQANLYSYQVIGYRWLHFMIKNGCGCILGDEMGLGKTLQIITLLGKIKEEEPSTHFLIVCPVSLLENWKREIAKFYPSLSTIIHHGSKRTGDIKELLSYDITITTYSCIVSDASMLSLYKWDILTIDEAQNIKNPNARRTKALCKMNRTSSVAISGTPFENHMTDIWSLTNFIMPNYLEPLNSFELNFPDTIEAAIQLEKIITPLILRRNVSEIAKDLPKRIDIPIPIEMTEEEAALYDDCISSTNLTEVLTQLRLDTIQKLRIFCTHPCVYNENFNNLDLASVSNKYERLCSILSEIINMNEKVVIFTSFHKMIAEMMSDFQTRYNVYTNYIDGSTLANNRQKIVDEFSRQRGSAILILNPKAAGVGLNITSANHAIHYNLEWNPAIEDQASARIYRRGQDKPVFIYRLYYINTIEDIINEKIKIKRELSSKAIIGNNGDSITKEDLIRIFKTTPLL